MALFMRLSSPVYPKPARGLGCWYGSIIWAMPALYFPKLILGKNFIFLIICTTCVFIVAMSSGGR
ncbi:hypothetical protein LguiA_005122 [Lonicera macranthoides]